VTTVESRDPFELQMASTLQDSRLRKDQSKNAPDSSFGLQQSMDDLMSSFIPSSSRSSKSGPHHKNDTFNVKLKVGGGTSIK